MNLTRLMTDKVFFEDQSGIRSGPFKTKFATGTIIIFQSDLKVTEGDRVIQPLPNGSEQIYIAEDVTFNSGLRNIPAHFSIKVVKESVTQKRATPMASTTYNISGANVQVGDHNIQNIAASMQQLAQTIEDSNFPPEQKSEAKEVLRSLVENPVVAAVLGGAAQGILGML